MITKIHKDAQIIINSVIEENLPNKAVINALSNHNFKEKVYVVAIGKAAWTMANTAINFLGDKVVSGVVVTKYDHSQGDIPNLDIIEAAHPIPDENTILGAQKAIDLVSPLCPDDEVLFLVSGGGSSLFEKPLDGITLEEITDINNQLLSSGADIVEINMIRKRLSSVKAGRFASLCSPATVFTIVLSDVIGDKLDSIASGPAAPDHTTLDDALAVVDKYKLNLSDLAISYLKQETPKYIDNVETVITGSVRTLCESASNISKKLGYTPYIITSMLDCEAKEAGKMVASIAKSIQNGETNIEKPCSIILGGETVVHLNGDGLGGRNQELVLSASINIENIKNTVIFSLGSDGTDGPTDAAGGIVDGNTVSKMNENGISPTKYLENNDAYNALKPVDGLIFTGPTGTNVNDVAVILCI